MSGSSEVPAFAQVSHERQHAFLVFLQAYKVVLDDVEESLDREVDLTLPEFEVLAWLYQVPGERIRMQDIADILLVSRGHVSRLIAGLESAGLVRREAFDGDRRGVFAIITDEGRALFGRAAPVFVSAYNRTFSQHLSDEDIERIDALMRRIVEGNGRGGIIHPSNYSAEGDQIAKR